MQKDRAMQGETVVQAGVEPPLPSNMAFDTRANTVVPADTGGNLYMTAAYGALPPAVTAGAADRPNRGQGSAWLVALAVLVAAVVPTALFNGYHLFQLTMVVVYAIAILGLALLIGFNGQISLGHGAFYAIGAYTTAILMANFDVPYWATLPASAIICAIVGFLIGLPALRLGGLYLALTSFSLAIAVPQLLKHNSVSDWTGGVQGLVIDKPEAPFGLPFSGDQWLYLFSLAIGCVMFLIAHNLVRGRIGRAMMAVRDHALAAEAMGVNLALLKTRTFAVSAMYTGIAGSLCAITVQFVAPDSFGVFVSIFLFVGLVVGGVASIGGTIIGALFIQFIPNVADQVSKAAPGAVYGVILIAMMFLMPQGAGGFLRSLYRLLQRSQ
jgi:branched-chain amino acid transport system permease protein